MPLRAIGAPRGTRAGPIRVLIVDPDENSASRSRKWLESDPARRFTASVARAAAEALATLTTAMPDAVLVSDCLPDMGGPAFVTDLLARLSVSLPAVVVIESALVPARSRQGFAPGQVYERLTNDELSPTAIRLCLIHGVQHANQVRELHESSNSLSTFAHTAAHDLKSPLRQIVSYAEILESTLQGQDLGDEQRYLTHIRAAGARMSELIKDLLTYASTDRPVADLEEVSVSATISNVLASLGGELEERKAVVTVGPLPNVMGERSVLRHLCFGLISNAIKFSGSRKPRVEVQATELHGQIVLAVRDNGIGISAGDRERIFSPFVRLNAARDYAGSGMGLATCKRAAESLGGRLWLESKLGVGSTFFVALSPVTKVSADATSGVIRRRPRILLVDDEDSELTLARELLGNRYELVSSSGEAEAMVILEEQDVDAVVCDYALGTTVGTSVLRRIQAQHPQVIRILTSAFPPPDLRGHLASGAVHYFFPKMASSKQLDAALAREVGQSPGEETPCQSRGGKGAGLELQGLGVLPANGPVQLGGEAAPLAMTGESTPLK